MRVIHILKAKSNFTAYIYTKELLAIFLLKSWQFLYDFLVTRSLKKFKQIIDKKFQMLSEIRLSELFTIVLI